MASKKTRLLIEATSKNYNINYSGGFRPDWSNLSLAERKNVLRHDARIMNFFIACPKAFKRIAELVHAVERYHRREAKKMTTGKNQHESR